MPSSFHIKNEVFEGPLSLLLELIERKKLLINDISLSTVTDEYMAYVRTLQEKHIEETSHFVLIASTLLLIKSKSLLPVLELTGEESRSVIDLQERLILYQLYRNAAKNITLHFGENQLYEKKYVRNDEPLFTPDKRTEAHSLKEALMDAIRRFPKVVFRPQVAVKRIMSLEEMILSVEERITRQFKFSFKDLVHQKERSHVIVSFLAILELVKQGIVLVQQETAFHDITIEKDGIDTPKYT